MYLPFTEQEKQWMYLDKWLCPIKPGCPANIRKTIEDKKKIIDAQMEKENGRAN